MARIALDIDATLIHPWNNGLVDGDGVIGAHDWPELERRIDRALNAG